MQRTQDVVFLTYLAALSLKEATGATHRARLAGLEAIRALHMVEDFIIVADIVELLIG